ncbi:MAG: arginine--tRNA ligase, partial [Candidatus Aenigmarchaeota archaeon]|nr:arginine--tRNA ligase [Candidatus Aenigmarchaeota archaeon]
MNCFEKFRKECEKFCGASVVTPPKEISADLALPCFPLGKNPAETAKKLSEKKIPKGSLIKEVRQAGPYLNFYIDESRFSKLVLKEVMAKKERYGKGGKKKAKVMVEFSQANTHKAFHVGHIRGTTLGESLARILEYWGNDVIRANYQGDTGMHVSKWIWCYQKYHSEEKPKKDESWIASIYVDAVKKLAENPELQKEVDEINIKLDSRKDKKLLDLWKKTRKLSLDAFEKIYDQLGTHFDEYYFESQVEKEGKRIALGLVKTGVAEKSEGAIIINLENYGLGVWVLLRKDGTVLYSAKDIALAQKKFKDCPTLDKSLYIVANEQDLHLKQLIKTLELMKSPYTAKLEHISYGLVKLPHGKISSRTGDNILYSGFMEEMQEYARKEILSRCSNLKTSELEKRAIAISISAIKYSMLKQSPQKDIIFDKEEALCFEGDTGPYLQYSYAWAKSILKKSKLKPKIHCLGKEEFGIVKKLSMFPE